jgi:glyoxalase family protein
VPEGSIDYWADRLAEHGVETGERTERFGADVLCFADHDGQPLELVEGESDIEPWADGPVPVEHAVRGFHGVTLHTLDPDAIASVLERLGFERAGARRTASDTLPRATARRRSTC